MRGGLPPCRRRRPAAVSMVVLAAVDVEALTGDRACHRRGQEDYRVGDLVGLRQPTQVGSGRRLLVDLLRIHTALLRYIPEVPLQRVTPDMTGRDGVDPDALRTELRRQRLRDRQQ